MSGDDALGNPPANGSRVRSKGIALVIMAVVFVTPAAIAFVGKFIKFMRTVNTDELGAVALIPMLNYLAVASGFICLLVWAIARGMFLDVEGPKYRLLENEEKLEQSDLRAGSQ